jgi:hypothetical protein
MGTVQMGFKSPVYKPEIMKMNTKIPAEVKVYRERWQALSCHLDPIRLGISFRF